MRNFKSLWVKRLQKYQRLSQISWAPGASVWNLAESAISYQPPTLTYKDVQFLIWKILFISVWTLKAKVMAWLLTWFIFAQSTLISYHTEAFVKTEVGCTVCIFFQTVAFCFVYVYPRLRKPIGLSYNILCMRCLASLQFFLQISRAWCDLTICQ